MILHGLYVAAGALLLGVAPAFGEWSVQTGAAVSYTTNIFQFSSASRLSIQEDPSQPIPVRDVLSKPSDVIWQPAVRLGRSWSSRLGTSEVSFKTEGALQHSTLRSRSFYSSTVTYGVGVSVLRSAVVVTRGDCRS